MGVFLEVDKSIIPLPNSVFTILCIFCNFISLINYFYEYNDKITESKKTRELEHFFFC